jgi:hypothetical protein
MKKLICISFAMLLLATLISPALSETPYLQIYFDSGLTQTTANCPYVPPSTIIDTLYIVAIGFNAFISAIEYRIDFTPDLVWLGDITTGLNIGDTRTGIATAWPVPQNAYSPLVVAEVFVLWMCEYCSLDVHDVPLCANGHSVTGYIRATRWPDLGYIYATNKSACICPTLHGELCDCPSSPIPVENSTWGQIKAFYH